jgi:triphosphoribosyl-dephospho-CoA synthase
MIDTWQVEWAQACFLRACGLDVAVRKPGNVSWVSPGHGMHAGLFIASARAAAAPLFEPGARVGRRIEQAVAASWGAAGCNTNLGILLLCAPIAAAAERPAALGSPAALQQAIRTVLADLDLQDARDAYRGIARANPGGLGRAAAQDVRDEPDRDLRSAMALAADRDRIARQYTNGFDDLFDRLPAAMPAAGPIASANPTDPATPEQADAVQRVFLGFLAGMPDSHIVRKHGEAVAQNVMSAAQAWRRFDRPGADPNYAAWDESLKRSSINPGTSADLTVATLLIAGLLAAPESRWHGS